MNKDKSRVENRFAAADEAARRGQAVYSEDGKDYSVQDDYPFRLSFYTKPPPETVTIDDLEMYAQDRLQVLRAIETASLLNKDVKLETQKAVEKYLPLKSNSSRSETLYEERRKDDVSHFMLRMAYCRSEELQDWFIRQECILFKHRFDQESQEDKKDFLNSLNVNWKMLSNEEKESMLEELVICTKPKQNMSPQEYVRTETFFEVDFEKVPQLVGRREVYLRRGKAYVPMSEQVNIIIVEYELYLKRALEATCKLLPRIEEDERLTSILLNIEKQYMGRTFNEIGSAAGTVSAQDVDALVQRHGPLCMRNLNDSLKHDKHLKHDGRLQFGLFIKGMGLSVEDALVFWRKAFSNITDDKFQKEYSYNVRYNYGLEGKRVNYSPYSCSKIINSNPPSSGDNHGCPLRHFSLPNLETRLHQDSISRTDADQILELVRNKHYQLACTRHFEVTHPQSTERMDAIVHPNQYYNASKTLDEVAEPAKEDDLMEID